MNRFRKVVSGLSFVLALMLVLSACGGGSKSESSGSGSASASADNGKTAELVMPFFVLNGVPKDIQLVNDEINKITKEKINATVKLLPISYGTYAQQTNLMLTGDEQVDLMVVGTWFNYTTQVAKNQLQPIDDLLQKYGQDVVKTLGDKYVSAGKVKGKTYGVATMRDLADEYGLVVPQEILDKNGVKAEDIKTFDDVEKLLAAIKKNDPNSTPLVPFGPGDSLLDNYMTYDNLGDKLGVLKGDATDLKVVNWFEQPEYAALLNKVRSWYQAGYIMKDAATNKDSGLELVKAGRGDVLLTRIKPGYAEQESRLIGKKVVTIPLLQPQARTSSVANMMWGIPRNSKYPEKAMQLLNLMFTDTNVANLLAWGIEGKHYVVNSDGTAGYPQGVDQNNSGYNLNQGWMFGNQFLTHVWQGDSTDLWKQLQAFNDSAVQSKALGFTFDQTPVKTEVAAVQNVLNQYKMALEWGTVDPAKVLPEFNKKLKDAGLEKIITEKQKQLDEWAASK
ncbi:ABC transporter substrate-binding protein [Cohnella candidum]|uniref:Extracellular solute-binding protein n=1 Tax=Cohnella candidum TaxID=2674991 RepID=A0A3G3K5E6_9BACL|nr:ABC transporter substrate-binding protein [Cohnella candidum]AYQ75307.1 extracellular solute-binding protein [Cohnella candidum]